MGKRHKHKARLLNTLPAKLHPGANHDSWLRLRRPELLRICGRIAVILGLSIGLAMVFNTSNPVGIRVTFKNRRPPIETISWTEANPLLMTTQIVLINAQSKTTYPSNSIPGSVSLPANSTSSELKEFATRHDIKRPIVVYSGEPDLAPAMTLSSKLLDRGYKDVRVMTNSMATLLTPSSSLLPQPPHSLATTSNQVLFSASQIAWREAKPLVAEGKVLLVDSRVKPQFDAAHIPSAISLPLESIAEEFDAFKKKYATNTWLVVYCASLSCSRSKVLADRLIQQYGYAWVRFMPGGYQEWQESEFSSPKPGG
jgi:rhodanese-related sulfurtransferase